MRTLSQIGSWALNPDTGELVLSREAYPLFGFDSDGDSPTCTMVVARMHPNDRQDAGERAERAFRNGTSLEGEYRILMPDGRVNVLHYVGHQVESPDGKREYVGTLLDVTSQTDVEALLDAKLGEARALAEKLMLTVQHSEELRRRVVRARRSRPAEFVSKSPAAEEGSAESEAGKITPRERQIVRLVAEARTTKQIAFQLGIGAKTVEAHRTHIMKKLGLHSASEIVRYAI
ncbi:MAG: sensor histidine kinase, partial [Gemmatimonadales bacterium]|nr:sensor histidine kinase [Gemmatimonadales bacterium]